MEVLIDSSLSFADAVSGTEAPQSIIDSLALIDVHYRSFDSRMHQGQVLVHGAIADEVQEIFRELLSLSFPIQKVVPIVAYGWDDHTSMGDNNSTAFHYRNIYGTDLLSNHSLGRALDINPFLNPCEHLDGQVVPIGSNYDTEQLGTFAAESEAVRVFTSRGWDWGGLWPRKDWQHFAKAPR